jgi:hypothetical protein
MFEAHEATAGQPLLYRKCFYQLFDTNVLLPCAKVNAVIFFLADHVLLFEKRVFIHSDPFSQ